MVQQRCPNIVHKGRFGFLRMQCSAADMSQYCTRKVWFSEDAMKYSRDVLILYMREALVF